MVTTATSWFGAGNIHSQHNAGKDRARPRHARRALLGQLRRAGRGEPQRARCGRAASVRGAIAQRDGAGAWPCLMLPAVQVHTGEFALRTAVISCARFVSFVGSIPRAFPVRFEFPFLRPF